MKGNKHRGKDRVACPQEARISKISAVEFYEYSDGHLNNLPIMQAKALTSPHHQLWGIVIQCGSCSVMAVV